MRVTPEVSKWCGGWRFGLACLLLATVAGCAATAPPPPPPALPPTFIPEVVYDPPPYVPYGEHTVATRLRQFGREARSRWRPWFERADVTYPPQAVVLVGLKREQRMQVYAGPSWNDLAFVRSIPWTATSGRLGPKRREGDKQIPEGIYELTAFNPNSSFHVSLRVGYPNEFDRRMAALEGRSRLGGDIMIHGGDRSIGCIAVGDEAAEDLFVLAADVGLEEVSLVLAPHDFRSGGLVAASQRQPEWVRRLYGRLDMTLRDLPLPGITTARGVSYAE